ncbi:hypothetical protein NZK35_23245 [Stieleria sp. ICT_E10.1]|nr:hypothetical protein [Stieleria sedimenti]
MSMYFGWCYRETATPICNFSTKSLSEHQPIAMLRCDMATTTKKRPKRRKPKQAATADRPEKAKAEKKPDLNVEGLKYFAMLRPLLEHLQIGRGERGFKGK